MQYDARFLSGDLVKYRAPFKGAFRRLYIGMVEATWMLVGLSKWA